MRFSLAGGVILVLARYKVHQHIRKESALSEGVKLDSGDNKSS